MYKHAPKVRVHYADYEPFESTASIIDFGLLGGPITVMVSKRPDSIDKVIPNFFRYPEEVTFLE